MLEALVHSHTAEGVIFPSVALVAGTGIFSWNFVRRPTQN